MTMMPLAVTAVLLVVLALFIAIRLLFRPDTRFGSVDRLRECLRTLALMKDGSRLGVLHKKSRRSMQFLRVGGHTDLTILFAVPKSRENAQYFDDIKETLSEKGWSCERSRIPVAKASEVELDVLQVRIHGDNVEVLDAAEELGRSVLEVLELSRDATLQFRLSGEADESAQRKELAESLGRLADSRIPWLRTLAQEQLDKDPET